MLPLFRRLSIGALVVLCCASPFVTVLAFPAFDGGLLPAQTVSVGVHALACLTAFAMLFLSIGSPDELRPGWNHGVLALGLIALVGAVLSPFSDYAPRTFYGSLEHGVGVLWFLEAAILAAGFSIAWTSAPRARVVMASAPSAMVVAYAALGLAGAERAGASLVPYGTLEYLGLGSLFAAVPLLALKGQIPMIAAAIVAVAGVAVSGSMGAWAALCAIAAVIALLAYRNDAAAHFPVVAVVLTLFLGVGLLYAAPALEAVAPGGVVVAKTPDVASTAPIDHVAIQDKAYGPLWQRSIAADLSARSMSAHPATLFVGMGFGAFEAVAREGFRSAPIRKLTSVTTTTSLPRWGGDHSLGLQNQFTETFQAGGIPGLASWLILVWVVGKRVTGSASNASAALCLVLAVALSFDLAPNAFAPMLAVSVAATLKNDLAPFGLRKRPAVIATPMIDLRALAVQGTLACLLCR